MGTTDTNIIQDGQLAVAVASQTGDMTYSDGTTGIECIVNTENGPQRAIKVTDVNGGGGGGTVDQTYDPTSTNAQSGTAVAEAVAPALKNTATGTNAIAINVRGLSAVTSNNSLAIGSYIPSLIGNNAIAISANSNVQAHSSSLVIGNAHSMGSGEIVISPSSYASCSAVNAIQLGGGINSNEKTLQVYEYPLLDGNTGLIPAERIDILTTAWNFSQSNCLQAKQVLDFESASTYHFVWHFITPSSTSSISQIMFGSIDVEGTGGGFDIAYNDQMKMYISQSAVGVSGWDFDAPISGTLSNSTEYWLDMTFDGTTYTYITATDKALTNVISTITNSSGKKIKNTASPAKFGAALRSGNSGTFGSGKIFMSDCKLQLDSTVVFDGAHGSQWKIVGTPSVVSTLS